MSATESNQADGEERRVGFLKRLLSSAAVVLSIGWIFFVVVMAAFPDVFMPHDPDSQSLARSLATPDGENWFGADRLGRDIFSRVVAGSRASVIAVATGISVAAGVGVTLGLIAGLRGGLVDRVISWFVDVVMSLPAILVAFAMIAVVGPGLVPAMVALGLVLSTRFARLTRALAVAERERLYVDAARVSGIPPARLVLRHLIPNLLPPLVVQASLLMGVFLLLEAALSFLGLGAPPQTISWGRMLQEARDVFSEASFVALPPGFAISFTVLALNVAGDGLRDALGQEVRVRRRHRIKPLATVGESSPDPDVALEVQSLTVSFPRPDGSVVDVVTSVDIALRRGEIVGLVGESGSGKSMSALAAMGLVPDPGVVRQGAVYLNGRDLLKASDRELRDVRGSELSVIFQEPVSALDPGRRVGRQIADPLRIHQGMDRSEARKRAVELLDMVGVRDAEHRLDDYPHQFSGGMAQRAMIARALACEPSVLIADEPTTALDVTVQAQILDLLRDLRDRTGTAILLITHDLGVVADVCDRVAVMYAGQIVEEGTAIDVLLAPSHPYTAALLGATPRPDEQVDRLVTIDGQVPPAWAWPSGCRFSNRCAHATDACQAPPELVARGDGLVRCLRADELDLRAEQVS